MSNGITVDHNTADARFEARTDGGLALLEYVLDGNDLRLVHTEVPAEAEGKGIAGQLVQAALGWARERKLRVVPVCPYVVTYVKRHHEYDDIVHPDYR